MANVEDFVPAYLSADAELEIMALIGWFITTKCSVPF
jgi:hypothetical protein